MSERGRDRTSEDGFAARASFLESLLDSIAQIASTHDAAQVLEQTRRQAEHLFRARASLERHERAPAGREQTQDGGGTLVVPLRVRSEQIGALRLEREEPFDRADATHAAVLADFAGRATENARLLADAQLREVQRARLSSQLITAEQDERRRLALFIHDGPVQSMSGIALMLDAALQSLDGEQLEETKEILRSAQQRQRDAIRRLRDLSFALEPVVLRDQGFGPAVRALAERLALSNEIRIEVDVEAADLLPERTQVGLYQVVQEALNQALHRGSPERMSVRVEQTADGGLETTITDDGKGERRRGNFEAIAERARTLNARLSVEQGQNGGNVVRVVLRPSSVPE